MSLHTFQVFLHFKTISSLHINPFRIGSCEQRRWMGSKKHRLWLDSGSNSWKINIISKSLRTFRTEIFYEKFSVLRTHQTFWNNKESADFPIVLCGRGVWKFKETAAKWKSLTNFHSTETNFICWLNDPQITKKKSEAKSQYPIHPVNQTEQAIYHGGKMRTFKWTWPLHWSVIIVRRFVMINCKNFVFFFERTGLNWRGSVFP